ncbi:hypothetical protein BAU14_08260 [Enterococcus sp. CU9D]|nr:hypothetical protein BAU14_08260 [Enterococcus sp. CU9D]
MVFTIFKDSLKLLATVVIIAWIAAFLVRLLLFLTVSKQNPSLRKQRPLLLVLSSIIFVKPLLLAVSFFAKKMQNAFVAEDKGVIAEHYFNE